MSILPHGVVIGFFTADRVLLGPCPLHQFLSSHDTLVSTLYGGYISCADLLDLLWVLGPAGYLLSFAVCPSIEPALWPPELP